ncbi:MAG TPA: NADH dehydrogenase (quinone) subunit D [Vicinamibacteria bacterium]|nr:NADH dehydrogenase (quinone) subunit D [Vicinamibacteria bacterium]
MASTVENAAGAAGSSSLSTRVLREALGEDVQAVEEFRGDLAVKVSPRAWVRAATLVRDHPELDFKLFLDLCGVDYLDKEDHRDRFEVVLHAYSVSQRHHLRLKTGLAESDPTLDTLVGVYKGANWFEREAWDLYGIVFRGHPNLTRLLTHEAFVGHPMRKDYPTAKRHVLKTPKTHLLDVAQAGPGMIINIGPSHPAMHGAFRVQARLDGETIVESEAEIGYMHRNFEKMAEERTYWQVIPYTDRLNYCSAFMNGHGWALAVEKLLGIKAPPRAEAVRVILSEFSRIMDHFVCIGANVVDLGAITPIFVLFRAREIIYDLLEACCGARLTVSYVRIGGLAEDVPEDFEARCRQAMKSVQEVTDQGHRLLTRNVIFARRFRDVGVMPAVDALSWGWVGPCLRGSGVAYDIRKDHPYSGYEEYDFDVPVGAVGDCYDRYLVRMEEIRQSLRIIEQALGKLPPGPVIVDDKKVALPPKSEVYSNIEALMNHFKLVYEGILPPRGEVYGYTEAANGELGYYIVSDGQKHPWRVKVRPPCFNIYQAFPEMIKGRMLADAVAIIGGLNVVAGELDR